MPRKRLALLAASGSVTTPWTAADGLESSVCVVGEGEGTLQLEWEAGEECGIVPLCEGATMIDSSAWSRYRIAKLSGIAPTTVEVHFASA